MNAQKWSIDYNGDYENLIRKWLYYTDACGEYDLITKSTNCNMHGIILMCKMTAMILDAGMEFLFVAYVFCSLEIIGNFFCLFVVVFGNLKKKTKIKYKCEHTENECKQQAVSTNNKLAGKKSTQNS